MNKSIKSIALAFLGSMLFQSVEASQWNDIGSQQDTIKAYVSQKLPFDKEVRRGKLSNGFEYFIRRNVEPKNRVTMYLALKVGSILENEKQLGLAHFLEHMQFNGSKHFPKNELVNYLQKVGVSFGHDLNAYTGFDQTVYQLPIPSDDPEVLKNGLLVMRDWAQDASLTDEEIDKERGVIMEELRGGRGAMQRMREQYFPMLVNGSRYAKRLPIGTEEIITTFPYEEIRKFHKDWYRPDLQAIIIVGDIDVNHIEREVKRLFSDMRVNPNAPKREKYNVPLLNKNQFMAVTDPEMTSTQIQIFTKHPQEKELTIGDVRKSLLKSVYSFIVNNRLSELRQSANPPYLGASVGVGAFINGMDAYFGGVNTNPNPDGIEKGFKTLLRELERVKKYGFTQDEFERAIITLNKYNEVAYTKRDKIKSDEYVKRYLDYFLEENPALSNEDSYNLTKQLLPTLTIAETEAIGKEYYVDTNRDILILAPEKEKANLPTEQQVNQWISAVQAENITPYNDKVSDLPMLAGQPKKGTIVSEKSLPQVGAKELTLSNGIKVILKQTNFKNDEILINGFSRGGHSLYGDKDYFTAVSASGYVQGSGLGQLNNIELQKRLTGKNVGINTYIGERSEGVSGSSDKEGLKTAFEMIYGYFTEPRIDDDIFQGGIARSLASLVNRDENPQFIFGKEISNALYKGHARRRPIEEADIKAIDKQRALQIYKDRFADASDFIFTIVGSFTEQEIKPLLEQYIASLPNLNRKEAPKDLGIYEPKKGFEKVVNKGKDEDKANVNLVYYTDYKYNELENLNIDALKSVLSIKLLERLREAEGGVYGTGARASYVKYPKPRLNFSIAFGTNVDKYRSLIDSALDEVEKVKKNGPSQTDLDKFKIEIRRRAELQMKENGFWLSHISSAYSQKESLVNPAESLKNLDKITTKSVQKVAKKYLNDAQLFKFILLPDEK